MISYYFYCIRCKIEKKKKKFFFEFAKIEGKASLHQTNFNLKFCHNICYMLNKDKIIHGGIPVMFRNNLTRNR